MAHLYKCLWTSVFLRLTTGSDTSIYISAGYLLGASFELRVGVHKDETGEIS